MAVLHDRGANTLHLDGLEIESLVESGCEFCLTGHINLRTEDRYCGNLAGGSR